MDETYQVIMNRCCAGVVVRDGVIIDAAPIVKGFTGCHISILAVWAEKHGGRVYKVDGALKSITCPVCGMTSFNQNDVLYGYCGNCHRFVDGSK